MGRNVRWTQQSIREDAYRADRLASGLLESFVRQELTVAGKNGEAEAKKFVSIAGTQKNWSGDFPDLRTGGPRRSKPSRGRVATGKMRDALTYRLNAEGRGLSTIKVGWLTVYEDYFGYQDGGFTSGGYRERVQDPVSAVEGMKLMAHMRFYMRDQNSQAADRAVKRIADAL